MQKLSFLLLIILIACQSTPSHNPDEEIWISLFNGQNLNDWDIKIAGYELNDNYNNTFQVKDSLLTVVYDEYDDFGQTFGHIFHKSAFSWYKLRTVYRFIGEQCPGGPGWAFRNNGLMIHSQSATSMAKEQDFPISIEVQLLGGDGTAERSTANLCTPGTHVYMADTLFTRHCIGSASKTYHGDQWVTVELLVYGDSLITHIVEGDTVMSYTQPHIGGGVANNYDPAVKKDGKALTEGYIALQGESHPTQFKTIEVLELVGCMDPKASNYKSYYVKSDNSKCRYD